MSDPSNEDSPVIPPIPGGSSRNIGDSLVLTDVQVSGVAAGSARGGDTLPVWTKLAITSDAPAFHRMADGLASLIYGHCKAAGRTVDLQRANVVVLVIRPDNSAELWVDSAAVSLAVLTKRVVKAGTAVYERDIADVVGMSFPSVKIGKDDKVICLFREGWRFGLYFDFNPGKCLSVVELERGLASLYRNLRYRHIYDAIERPEVFSKLISAGWFPFAEIITAEFRDLVLWSEAGFDLGEVEARTVAAFDAERLDHMLARWLARPHFASRETILRSAIKNFLSEDPVAVIKTVLTEIEGVLNAAHRAAHGKGAPRKELVAFATESAVRRAGGSHTLLLSAAFAKYLEERTFARFDPNADDGAASSRHAVGHGAASADTYTQVAALQALLTLDQFAFFT